MVVDGVSAAIVPVVVILVVDAQNGSDQELIEAFITRSALVRGWKRDSMMMRCCEGIKWLENMT